MKSFNFLLFSVFAFSNIFICSCSSYWNIPNYVQDLHPPFCSYAGKAYADNAGSHFGMSPCPGLDQNKTAIFRYSLHFPSNSSPIPIRSFNVSLVVDAKEKSINKIIASGKSVSELVFHSINEFSSGITNIGGSNYDGYQEFCFSFNHVPNWAEEPKTKINIEIVYTESNVAKTYSEVVNPILIRKIGGI